MVDSADDLQPEWFEGKRRVGVTAGASAPEVLVQQVIERLRALGAVSVRKLHGRRRRRCTSRCPRASSSTEPRAQRYRRRPCQPSTPASSRPTPACTLPIGARSVSGAK